MTARPEKPDRELILSLTTWTPRLPYIRFTLRSLTLQSVRPDKILLWVAESDFRAASEELAEFGGAIEILSCPDVGPFKKLIYTLERYPESYIVTADDDVCYPQNWLRAFAEELDPGNPTVLCQYSMRFHFEDNGKIAKYREWTFDPQDRYARRPSDDLLPVGVGGILYPPGCFHEDVGKSEIFDEIAMGCDDAWFYAMTRLTGTKQRKVGARFEVRPWPGTQQCAISRTGDFFGRNDIAIGNIARRYGWNVFSPH